MPVRSGNVHTGFMSSLCEGDTSQRGEGVARDAARGSRHDLVHADELAARADVGRGRRVGARHAELEDAAELGDEGLDDLGAAEDEHVLVVVVRGAGRPVVGARDHERIGVGPGVDDGDLVVELPALVLVAVLQHRDPVRREEAVARVRLARVELVEHAHDLDAGGVERDEVVGDVLPREREDHEPDRVVRRRERVAQHDRVVGLRREGDLHRRRVAEGLDEAGREDIVEITAKLKALQDSANTELNAEVEKINKETEDLKKQKDLMAEDVWMEKAKQLSVKQNNLPALREVKVRELSISEQQALGKINDAMMPILKKIVEDRGATVMLDRSAVMYASVDTNITAEVIAELDKVMSTVKVEKVSLADLQRQALEAQKKNDDKKKK